MVRNWGKDKMATPTKIDMGLLERTLGEAMSSQLATERESALEAWREESRREARAEMAAELGSMKARLLADVSAHKRALDADVDDIVESRLNAGRAELREDYLDRSEGDRQRATTAEAQVKALSECLLDLWSNILPGGKALNLNRAAGVTNIDLGAHRAALAAMGWTLVAKRSHTGLGVKCKLPGAWLLCDRFSLLPTSRMSDDDDSDDTPAPAPALAAQPAWLTAEVARQAR
jgi:hypothetical protein